MSCDVLLWVQYDNERKYKYKRLLFTCGTTTAAFIYYLPSSFADRGRQGAIDKRKFALRKLCHRTVVPLSLLCSPERCLLWRNCRHLSIVGEFLDCCKYYYYYYCANSLSLGKWITFKCLPSCTPLNLPNTTRAACWAYHHTTTVPFPSHWNGNAIFTDYLQLIKLRQITKLPGRMLMVVFTIA